MWIQISTVELTIHVLSRGNPGLLSPRSQQPGERGMQGGPDRGTNQIIDRRGWSVWRGEGNYWNWSPCLVLPTSAERWLIFLSHFPAAVGSATQRISSSKCPPNRTDHPLLSTVLFHPCPWAPLLNWCGLGPVQEAQLYPLSVALGGGGITIFPLYQWLNKHNTNCLPTGATFLIFLRGW